MAKMRGAVVIDTERCKGCNLCVVACPTQTLALSKTAVNHRGYAFSEDVNAESCIGCTACATVCPAGCIVVYRLREP